MYHVSNWALDMVLQRIPLPSTPLTLLMHIHLVLSIYLAPCSLTFLSFPIDFYPPSFSCFLLNVKVLQGQMVVHFKLNFPPELELSDVCMLMVTVWSCSHVSSTESTLKYRMSFHIAGDRWPCYKKTCHKVLTAVGGWTQPTLLLHLLKAHRLKQGPVELHVCHRWETLQDVPWFHIFVQHPRAEHFLMALQQICEMSECTYLQIV